ncbi:SEMA5A [Cordylochernes scorpioides]|uniref:SEMA5A n=1 Tax=Cordylochernes scorpioides TaxID=51811 RepID=A0ABY6LEL5_9ARAC|nr:SEMA5A [Cordylochernes scorpioides]
MPWTLLYLLLLLLVAGIQSRQVHYSVLKPDLGKFEQDDVESYLTIVPDILRYQLLVGARKEVLHTVCEDAMKCLYGLSKTSESVDLRPLETALWPSEEAVITKCQQKGQSRETCRNFVKVVHIYGTRVFACGTNAFSPECSWREVTALNPTQGMVNGVAKCPYDPTQNHTSLITQHGDFFIGGPLDFSSLDFAIYKIMGAPPFLRTVQYDPKWLNEPQFVASYEIGDFVYFFFREIAVEYINCGKVIYSRVARVCKSDQGGQYVLRDNWTTFVKARLNCSLPGPFPFYYHELQGVDYREDEGLFFLTFNTPMNSIPGAAVCAYNISQIEGVFAGPFKVQEDSKSAWERAEVESSPVSLDKLRKCVQCEATRNAVDAVKYQLMDEAVQPVSLSPLHSLDLARFHHIAVDVVPTKYHDRVHVIFVSTVEGTLRKLLVDPGTRDSACLIEELHPLPPGTTHRDIFTMKLIHDTGSLYLGTKTAVVRVPLHRCHQYSTLRECLNSRDPYCGWNLQQVACTPAPNSNHLSDIWKQSVLACPDPATVRPVDGEWGEWGPWHPCDQADGLGCLCQQRACDNPAPANGGQQCHGRAIRITNCTRNGDWTSWSAWSSCSATCGLAKKFRYRTCTSPRPAFGGSECSGLDREDVYCTNNPPCPSESARPSGEWSEWGGWSECTAPCGQGSQRRYRRCRSGNCAGCGEQTQSCNSQPCPEVHKLSIWTPWLIATGPEAPGSGYEEHRFRFSCHANVSDSRMLHLSHYRREVRFCHGPGICSSPGDGTRRVIAQPHCLYSKYVNTAVCPLGQWSCWSEFTPCSAPCGGTRVRRRHCQPLQAKCQGEDTQHVSCSGPAPCDDNSIPVLATQQDVGPNTGLAAGYIVLVALVTFAAGLAVGLALPCRLRAEHSQLLRLSARVDSKANTYVSQHEWADPPTTPHRKEATIRRNSHPIRVNLDSDSF